MSEELKYKLFSPTDCLSEQTMYDYIDHRLSPKAQHIVEKHLLECELCSDALEGLRLVKDRNITAEINSAVSERMALPPVVKKEQRFSYRTLIAVAAVLLLLIGGVSLFNHFSSSGRMDSSGMADLKQKNPGQEAPPPPQESQVFDSATTGNAVSATDETGAKPEQKADIHTSTPETTVSSSNGYAETDKFESTPSAEERHTEQVPPAQPDVAAAPAAANAGSDVQQNTTSQPSYKHRKEPEEAKDQALDKDSKQEQDNFYIADRNAETELRVREVTVSPSPAKSKKTAEQEKTDKEVSATLSATPGVQSITLNSNSLTFNPSAGGTYSWTSGDSTRLFVKTSGSAGTYSLPDTVTPIAGITQGFIGNTSTSTQPQFPGGYIAILKFIDKNASWPVLGNKDSISSTKIIAQFTIDANGKVTDPKILKGINPAFDREALRVISLMPKWIPAKKNGQNSAYLYTLPIQVDIK